MEEGYPIVSVITPTYNIVDKELTDEFSILVSLLNKQSYPNIEHIIIDKASTDGTVQLLQDYKNGGYFQFYSEPDTGRYDALNKGIMRAKGKYVCFLDCDDFNHNLMSIAEMVALLEENDADYTYGTGNVIHPEGFVFEFSPAMYNVFQVMPCSLQSMMFKKNTLAAEGYFDSKFKYMADFDLIMRLVLKEYGGVYYEKNFVTSTLSKSYFDDNNRINDECRQVYIKNFRNLYPLTNDIVDKMVELSEFPQPLLEKLSQYFPEESHDDFMTACEDMHQMRIRAAAGQDITGAEEPVTEENQTGQNVQQNPAAPTQPQSTPMQSAQSQQSVPRMPNMPTHQTQPQSLRPQNPIRPQNFQ